MTPRIRLAIIGAGKMGARWIRVARASPRFDLAAVVDPGVPSGALRSIEMAPPFDAAIVATPTPTHYEIAHGLLLAGVHVLVEKPLAANYNDAWTLVAAAAGMGVCLAVGHVERFNPAARALFEAVRSGAIGDVVHARATRVGPKPERGGIGDNVALDLAVHDLDLMRGMFGPLRISYASAIDEDARDIDLTAASGLGMSCFASWLSDTRSRLFVVDGARGHAVADLIARTLTVRGNLVWAASEPADPLTDQLAAFARLIDGEDASPLCSGEDGAAAVLLAERAMRVETGGSFV